MSIFHEPIDRTRTASVKWELTKEIFGEKDLLPMWVADMDFRPPEKVIDAIKERVEHGIFGYTFIPPSTHKAIQQWLEKRHHWRISLSWIIYHNAVVPAISTAINTFTKKGDKILLQSPIYTPFFEMIEKNERTVVNNSLVLKDNRYEIDFIDFENKLQSGVKLFLLCSPHNPGGRVWSKEELIQMAELCKKYDCLILSDEIHSDLIFQPAKHIPIASIQEHQYSHNILTCIAPSKTFNLAGLQSAAIIIEEETLRKRYKEALSKQGFFTLNIFGILGMESAYRYGEEWLDSLLLYLEENSRMAKNYIRTHLPDIEVMNSEGTYLLWLNCRKLGLTDTELKDRLIQKGKIALEPGTKYGEGGEGFVRMNIACPQEVLQEGLIRLKKAFA